MPLFLIERNFAEELELNSDDASRVKAVNDEIGVQWLYSFLSADKRKSYCHPNHENTRRSNVRDTAGVSRVYLRICHLVLRLVHGHDLRFHECLPAAPPSAHCPPQRHGRRMVG